MDFHAYLTKHDGSPKPHGSELIRLATECGKSPMYFYLTALGHKRVGKDTAQLMELNSIDGELSADEVNKKDE